MAAKQVIGRTNNKLKKKVRHIDRFVRGQSIPLEGKYKFSCKDSNLRRIISNSLVSIFKKKQYFDHFAGKLVILVLIFPVPCLYSLKINMLRLMLNIL